MPSSIGFIGGGRVTRVILGGWKHSGYWPARVVVSDKEPTALELLRAAHPAALTVLGDHVPIAGQEVVFLALHPPVLRPLLNQLRGQLAPAALVVSLAPKVTIADISTALGGFKRIARVIPNAPSIVGAGFNPVSFAPSLLSADRRALASLLAPLGSSPEVPESDLEAYAVLSGMGPTYLWFQFYELLSIAEGFGVTQAAATAAIEGMVKGTLRTMLESGLSAPEVMDLVPVRPLADDEQAIRDAYRKRLRGVFDKIRPAVAAT